MSSMTQRTLWVRPRSMTAALLTAMVVLPLAACNTFSSSCSSELGSLECRLEISGSGRHDLPYPVDAAHGSEKPASMKEDEIRLIEASAGGPATVDINYDEHECGVGESFTVESTTFTCTEIGDESIVLDLVRG